MAGPGTRDLLPLYCLDDPLPPRSRVRGVVSALAWQRDAVLLACSGGPLVEQGLAAPAH